MAFLKLNQLKPPAETQTILCVCARMCMHVCVLTQAVVMTAEHRSAKEPHVLT